MITANAIQQGRHQLTERALEGVVIQAGGKLKVSAHELATMPDGSLAFTPKDDESV